MNTAQSVQSAVHFDMFLNITGATGIALLHCVNTDVATLRCDVYELYRVISGDMFLNVTSATSSEEGAVDLPGAQARSKAPDVLNS